jgi:FtsZ-interacting cell division protein ZipA
MVFVFLAVGAVALFSMVSVAVWSEARRKEREAYYKNDMIKRRRHGSLPRRRGRDYRLGVWLRVRRDWVS